MDKCAFCEFRDADVVIKDYKHWTLILAESQSVLGWTLAILKRHILFFEELSEEELIELRQAVRDIKCALDKEFQPDWFNVMQLGNATKHLHVHLVPRYRQPRRYAGRVFTDPDYGKMMVDRWNPEEKAFLAELALRLRKSI